MNTLDRLKDENGLIEKKTLKFRSYNIKKIDSSPHIPEKFMTPDLLTINNEKDQALESFSFNILAEMNPLEKQRDVWSILMTNGCIDEFMIPINTLCEFINIINIKYNQRKNPFHNFDHGVSGFLSIQLKEFLSFIYRKV